MLLDRFKIEKFLPLLTYTTICSAIFALTISLLRLVVVLRFTTMTRSSWYYLGILASTCPQWFMANIIVISYWLLWRSKLRILAPLPILIIIFINLIGFHYEAFFFRLPGINIVYYMQNMDKINTSLDSNAPLPWVLAEILLPLLILHFSFQTIARRLLHIPAHYFKLLIMCQILMFAAGITIYAAPGFNSSFYWGSRETISHFQQSGQQKLLSLIKRTEKTPLKPDDVGLIREHLGLSSQPIDIRYPFCENSLTNPTNIPNPRNIILVIMEGVDARSLEFTYRDVRLMPNLTRIARENLSFQHFFAAGSQSAQALPPIFSGQPIQSAGILIRHEPMLKMSGFPAQLRQQGYATAYLHGGNITYENQDLFLKMIGFDELHTYDPLDKTPVYGWGYSDEVMFKRLQGWITDHHQRSSSPYLATFFTASTHDPYILPTDYQMRFEGEDKFSRYADSVHYFDKKLGDFYAWYLKEEAPKGTLLVIVSDHIQRVPFPNAPEETSTGEFEYAFQTPLVIAGLSQAELQQYRAFSSRFGSQLDLPATLMPLLGYQAPACNAGLNLLSPQENWPTNRFIVSVAPDDARFIYIQKGNYRWMYDLNRDVHRLYNTIADPYFQHDLFQPEDPQCVEVEKFVQAYRRLSNYLIDNDAYSPIDPFHDIVETPIAKTTTPNYVLSLEAATNPQDKNNGLKAIDRAIAAGFNWTQIFVNITKDKELVLLRDSEVTLKDGQKMRVIDLTLAELRSIPGYENVATIQHALATYGSKINLLIETTIQEAVFGLPELLAQLAQELMKRPPGEQIVINIFGTMLVRATIDQGCHCELAYKVPADAPLDINLFQHIRRAKYQWIYLTYQQATPTLIAQAHQQGLKVMLYLINDRSELAKFADELPDGAITRK